MTHIRAVILTTLALVASLASPLNARAQGSVNYEVIYSFGALPDGQGPYSNVIFDPQGNIYGTTVSGGTSLHMGTVFELSANGGGGWTETILHNFTGGTTDGLNPHSGVALGSGGVLYGTSTQGGSHRAGTAYSLTPSTGGWTENILWSFGGNMGVPGYGTVLLDKAGNIYGSDSGLYELSAGDSGWTYSTICAVQFCPTSAISATSNGVIFAASYAGGLYGGGTVFEVTPGKNGWQERTLYNFGGFQFDGEQPSSAALADDSNGNIYGTTSFGGRNTCNNGGCGTIYKLTRGSNGQYTETILYNFQSPSAGTGFTPAAGVILDKAGNLYGTTPVGGATGCGVVYRLSPNKIGSWVYTVLHDFNCSDGNSPEANLTFGPDGNLYGTTLSGGASGWGVVFEISRR